VTWRPGDLASITEDALRELGTVGIGDEHGEIIGEAVWRAELGKWDCRDERFGIRAWARTFVRAESTVRRLVEKRSRRPPPPPRDEDIPH